MAEAEQATRPPQQDNAAPSSPSNTESLNAAAANLSLSPPKLSPRANSDTTAISASSQPLGPTIAGRRPPGPAPTIPGRGGLTSASDIQARMKAFRAGRQAPPVVGRAPSTPAISTPGVGTPSPQDAQSPPVLSPPNGLTMAGGIPAGFKLPAGMGRPSAPSMASAPAVPGAKLSLAEKRGLKMPGAPNGAPAGGKKKPGLKLADINGGTEDKAPGGATQGSMMDKYANFINKETGSLTFAGKAVLNSEGVQFSEGASFNISLDEVDTLDELGKGNYGTVYKVRHARPRIRKVGQGLAGNKSKDVPPSPTRKDQEEFSPATGGTTGVVMAMKEIRLELDDAKFAAIIMELDILHRCVSPQIIDFYGAFFQEGAVYICMEFMDGGSIDKLYGDGIPEPILRKITLCTTQGLKALKEDHNIIHRDVKPTNILMNTRGQIKICDFGVSGNLVASIAKTNIGCQSYMAPERISSGGVAQAGANPGGGTYSVQSDIWSLGLSIIECAMGRYPYPPETYNNIFSQLSAIVDGEPPDLPPNKYSDKARDFVRGCLNKIPKLRPTYAMLMQHPWLSELLKPDTITEEDEEAAENGAELPTSNGGPTSAKVQLPTDVVDPEVAEWVIMAIERRRQGKMAKAAKPALHAAPLDAVQSPGTDGKDIGEAAKEGQVGGVM